MACVASGFICAAAPAPVAADEIHGLPFYAQPFPTYYAYVGQRPACFRRHVIATPDGPAVEIVNICDRVVRARY